MKNSENTLTIAVDAKLHSNIGFCQWLSAISKLHCKEMSIKTILLSTANSSLLPSINTFHHNGIIFNQVFHTTITMNKSLLQDVQPDILFCCYTHGDLIEIASSVGIAFSKIEPNKALNSNAHEMHLVFDADAVLFSDESEKINLTYGYEEFDRNEYEKRDDLLHQGPLFSFINKIDVLQKHHKKIQWSLLTARSGKALFRAVHTIDSWLLTPSQLFFMSGKCKSTVLKSLNAQIFFDDKEENCLAAKPYTLVAHVPETKPVESLVD